jgi:hypothetical protein
MPIARLHTLKPSTFSPVDIWALFMNQELFTMCDYSLHDVASRPAKVGDKLRTTRFPRTLTCGFSAIGEPGIAVCLRPGTEIAFEADVGRQVSLLQLAFFGIVSLFTKKKWREIPHQVGRFRQINLEDRLTHHDAIEFPDGRTILLTQLRVGQRAIVLQLPAHIDEEASPNRRPGMRTLGTVTQAAG